MVSRRALLRGAAVAGAAGAGAVGYRAWRDPEPPSPPTEDQAGHLVWRNWSGLLHAYPQERAAPENEAALLELMKVATPPIRPVGAGHSFTPLVPTDGTLITLDRMTGVVDHDAHALQATVRAGTRLGDLGPALAAIGQEMPNLPDINKQSLAGGLATATHGTGRAFKALHGNVLGMRLISPGGELMVCQDTGPLAGLFQCALSGLGAFGVVSEVTLQNAALTRVKKRVEPRPLEDVLADWPRLIAAHRNVEFFALPFTGIGAVVTLDVTDEPVRPRGPDADAEILMDLKRLRDFTALVPPLRRWVAETVLAAGVEPEESVDEGWKLLSNERPVRFNEMEYHLPLDAQIPALREVLAAIETHRSDVFFPIEARVIDADDAWLSPFYQRVSGSIAVHAYYKDDHTFFFDLIEPIFRRYEGRPHWGKMHSLRAPDFAQLYPRWKEVLAVREVLDPKGRMLNAHLREVFGT